MLTETTAMGTLNSNPKQSFSINDPKNLGIASLVLSGLAFITTPIMGLIAGFIGIVGAYYASKQKFASEFTYLNIIGAIIGYITYLITQLLS